MNLTWNELRSSERSLPRSTHAGTWPFRLHLQPSAYSCTGTQLKRLHSAVKHTHTGHSGAVPDGAETTGLTGHTESPPDTTPVSVRRTEGVAYTYSTHRPPSPTPPVCWTRLVRPLRTRASSINILNKINSGTPTTATPLSAHASLPLHIRSASIAILAHRHRA